MYHYFAFGGCLRSELEFPDLSPLPARDVVDREVRVSAAPSAEDGEFQGLHEVEPGWVLRLYRSGSGLRVDYGPTGSYEILSGGREITWHPGPDRRLEVARAVLLGPVMALALYEAGILCLHGSAVAVDDRGAAFLAPKGYGKSTLAVALVAGGARLMSDDVVAVKSLPEPCLIPGVHSARLFKDVQDTWMEKLPGTILREGWKGTITNFPAERLCWGECPLDAIYLLEPVMDSRSEHGAHRARLPPIRAVTALARHKKLSDEMIGYHAAGTMLKWIGDLVSRVPVYQLHIARDLERLPDVARQVLAWH